MNDKKDQEYKIWSGRLDIESSMIHRFYMETDEEAIAYFNEFCKTPAYQWDKMRLEGCAVVEIIKPARNLANNYYDQK